MKITGFTRFLLFMIVFVPSVVFGVLYLKHGEEGLSMQKAIELFSGNESVVTPEEKIAKLEKEIQQLQDKIDEKQSKIESLRQ